MMLQEKKSCRRLGVFSVIWIIVTSGGVFFNSGSVVNYALIFDVILVFVQLFFAGRHILHRNSYACFLFLGMVLIVAMSVIINSDYASFLTYARLILVLALALGTSLVVSNTVMVETLVKTVLMLAVISVVLFYTEFVARNSGSFPVIEFHDYRYVNAFVYLFFDGLERNLSIFIEPGLYQIYLNIALFLIIYGGRDFRYKHVSVLILLVAIYSTNSTTGFIVSLVIIGGQSFSFSHKKKNVLYLTVRIILTLLAVTFVLMSDFFWSNMENKFQSGNYKSYETRQNSSIIDMLIIAKNPLTGGGVGSYQNSLDLYSNSGFEIDAATNTFTQLGATVGVPFTLLVLWRTAIYIKNLKLGFIGKMILFYVYIISFSTEPFILYPLFYLPVFMSIQRSRLIRVN